MPEPYFLERMLLEGLGEFFFFPKNKIGWDLSIPASRGKAGLGTRGLGT